MRDEKLEYEAPRVTDLEDAGRLNLSPLANFCSGGSGTDNSCGGGSD
jgi:hypothetical protein